jgi:integrase/recombinase XerD
MTLQCDILLIVDKVEIIKKVRVWLLHMLNHLGDRVGVQGVHPHRFRHTFAIEYLRNGGDVFTLQRLLGHSSLDICNRYLQIVKSDIGEAHKRASPADRWRL